MNKHELCDFLRARGIAFEYQDHPAAFTVEEVQALNLPHPESGAKNLFLRDNRKQNYFLLTMPEDKPLNLKAFAAAQGLHRLSFVSENELMEILGLIPGSVTPFGLLNDQEKRVRFFLDADYRGRLLAAHPLENTATVWLMAEDMMALLTAEGSRVEWVEI